MIVVLDDFSLDGLLNMSVFGFVFLIQHPQLSNSFLEVSQLILSLFDGQFKISQIVTILVDSPIQLVVLVLIALDLFSQNLLLEQKLFLIPCQFLQSSVHFIVIFSQES